MSKKNIGLLVLLLGVGAIYVFNFTNLFQTPQIEINTKIRPTMIRKGRGPTSAVVTNNTVSFSFNGKYQLTSLRVVEESDFKTNKYPHALWHLISESNSVPTKMVIYGVPVQGMKPKIDKLKTEMLRTNTTYVLLLESGKLKGQTSFQAR